jgi:hypothetical protein
MPDEQPPEDDNRGAGNRAVIVAVAVLLAIGLFLMHEYSVNQQKENCLIEGHRDCGPVTIIPNQ